MRRRIRKGLAVLLTATMVVGLMPGAGTIKVSAAEGEASGSVATAEGYDENGFCTSFELTNGTWALKSGETCNHDNCNGYQPAVEELLDYDINGDGTTDANDKAYKITNAGQLYWFADKVNNDYENYKDKNAVLTKDITVNEGVLSDGALNTANESTFRSWTPIGYYADSTLYPYNGIFDGAGHTITELYVNADSTDRVGLFGINSGTIKNVGIVNSYFGGTNMVGSVCGYNYTTNGIIENCYNIDSIISGSMSIGGVSGFNEGTITSCENTGNVLGSDCVGGVCGGIDGLVKNCSNRGNVKASNSGAFGGVGGVCGYFSSGSLGNSYNIGEVDGKSNIGGICGDFYTSNPSIKNCYYKTKEDNSLAAIGSDGGGYKIYVEGKTFEQFSNGMVAYLLNSRSGEDSPVWYQNIDNGATPDTAPVLDSSHGIVYASKPCPVKCSNTESTALAESQAHSFGDDNICTVCGAKGEIIDDPALKNHKPEQDAAGVYQITTNEELYYFVALVNGRLVGVAQDTSASAVLKTDITVNDNVLDENGNLVSETVNLKTWVPIGYSDGVSVQTYTGTFDGGGHTISGLYFADSSISYVGLFGSSTGTIKNIKVADSYFKGDTYVGGICGKNEGNIEGCEVSGKVEANNKYADFGGICGYNGTGYVKNCKSTVDISYPIHNTDPNGGGIVGQNDGTIENCHNIGEVYLRNTNEGTAGGICGKNNTSGTIKNSYNVSSVTGNSFMGYTGGICGENYGSIANCYSTGDVIGDYKGKVCGNKSSGVTNCYYQDSSESDSIAGTTFKEATQFASGEVAYLLNEGKTDNDVVWRQTLNTDTAPVLDSTHSIVYASKPCESEFANTEFTEEKKHTVTMSEDGTSHTCSVCKKTEQHADVATFAVDDETHSITADCPSCGTLGTITLSASDATYDGADKAASISGEIKGFDTPSIVYEKKGTDGSFATIDSTPKDAGTYRASITYTVDETKNKVYSVRTEYTIARRPVTITANNENKTYGKPDPTLSYTVSEDTPLVDGEQLTGTLSREDGDNAGTYKIRQGTVTNDGNPNYDITFNEGTLTIDKADANGIADCEMELQYDETSGRYTATIGKVDKAEYRFDSGEWSSENTLTGIAHGTEVTGYIRIAGDDNHNPGAESSKTLTSGHGTLKYVEAKEADCVNEGNEEYWYCESCGKYFSDAEGTKETTKDAVTNGTATGHQWDTETYTFDATHHWHKCLNADCPITDNSLKEGYGEHVDGDNDGICEVCKNRIWYIVSPSSMLLDRGDSVSNISMNPVDGKVKVGETVTVTTKDMLGYRFMGWYLKSNINEYNQLLEEVTPQSTSFTYTFIPEDNMSLVAVYEAAGKAEVKISGSGFKVSVPGEFESAEQDGTYNASVDIGSEVTITIVDKNVEFISWTNESNKIVSTDRIYAFIVTGNTTLTMSKKGTTGSTAMVEFVSAYNQVIAGRIYGSSETITFPDGPSKMGYIFKEWSLSEDGIHTKISEGETHITVTPVYEQDTTETYTVTVYVDGVQDDSQTATGILAGTTKTVKAPTVDGKVFLYWTDADGNILGYDASYFMQINKDIVVKAVYGEEAVDVKPVIAMTNVFTTSTGGKNKISFTVTRDIPEGYTLVEHGVLYNKDGTIENPTEDTFVLGGTYVSKYTSTATKLSGIVTVNLNMTGAENTKVVARGYMIVKNSEGNDEIYYSEIAYASYNEKK